MQLPNPKTLGRALGYWREHHKKRSVELVQQELSKRGLDRSIKTIVNEWEGGKIKKREITPPADKSNGIKVTYAQLAGAVFPAYHVDDMLAFWSLCQQIQGGVDLIDPVGEYKPVGAKQESKVKVATCALKHVEEFPFRLDFVELHPGAMSIWHEEPALEFMYVVQGKVRILHAKSKDTPAEDCEHLDLDQHHGAKINSNRPHRVHNRHDGVSLIAVAKSPRSKEAGCDSK